MNWSASAGRSAGFLLSAHITTCSSSSGTCGLTAVGTAGASDTCLMAIVTDDLWGIANFKETQITVMRPGQAATIEDDAYPGVEFAGHVDSIQTGSGARFSLLPPENATGNYVKVVQRVPVKIVFDEKLPDDLTIAPGMSVVPEVRVK